VSCLTETIPSNCPIFIPAGLSQIHPTSLANIRKKNISKSKYAYNEHLPIHFTDLLSYIRLNVLLWLSTLNSTKLYEYYWTSYLRYGIFDLWCWMLITMFFALFMSSKNIIIQPCRDHSPPYPKSDIMALTHRTERGVNVSRPLLVGLDDRNSSLEPSNY